MRQYTSKDYEYIYKSLSDEGFTSEQMTFETDHTYLTDKGFFSYRIENNYPRLTHFFIDKRSLKVAQSLMRDFLKILRDEEHLFFIMEVPKEKPYMEKIAKYIKGVRYFEKEKDIFYYVPVFKGRFK